MVKIPTIHNWFSSSSTSPSDPKRSKLSNHISRFRHNNHHHNDEKLETLGILAFDTAKIMSRLISLYKSLSDYEINRLRQDVMKSRGISYLNSDDEGFLLTLACAERLEDLDRVASVVARLGLKCSDFGLNQFDQMYRELKLGNVNGDKLNYGAKAVEKIVNKMEKLTATTSNLYSELEALSELEISERKVNMWRTNPGTHAAGNSENSNSKSNSKSKAHGQVKFDLFDRKIGNQRKLVRHFKAVSLWNQSYDKCVRIMARVVCVLYVRICTIFSPYVYLLPTSMKNSHVDNSRQKMPEVTKPETWKLFDDPATIKLTRSGPIVSTTNNNNKASLIRFSSSESNVFVSEIEFCVGFEIGNKTSTHGCSSGAACPVHHNNKVFKAAPSTTVGGSGMAMRYANVITIADNFLNSNSPISDQAREDLYNMLPANMKANVGSKLRNAWKQMVDEGKGGGGDAMAEGWRQPISNILEWLSPMAHDTLIWQTERNMERQRFDAKPTVLLLQTLHYSDLEKTEAAIVNVLVGLSCIYWYENRRSDDM